MGYGARIRVVAGVLYNAIADKTYQVPKLASQLGLIADDGDGADSLDCDGKLNNDGMLLSFCQGNDPGSVLAIGVELGERDDKDFYDWRGNRVQDVIGFEVTTLQKLVDNSGDKIDRAQAYIDALPEAFRNHKRISKFGVWVVSDVDE